MTRPARRRDAREADGGAGAGGGLHLDPAADGVDLEHVAVTAHVEAFGQRRAKPTVQIGARTEIAKGLQLDGTVGRGNRETLVSVGIKASF